MTLEVECMGRNGVFSITFVHGPMWIFYRKKGNLADGMKVKRGKDYSVDEGWKKNFFSNVYLTFPLVLKNWNGWRYKRLDVRYDMGKKQNTPPFPFIFRHDQHISFFNLHFPSQRYLGFTFLGFTYSFIINVKYNFLFYFKIFFIMIF